MKALGLQLLINTSSHERNQVAAANSCFTNQLLRSADVLTEARPHSHRPEISTVAAGSDGHVTRTCQLVTLTVFMFTHCFSLMCSETLSVLLFIQPVCPKSSSARTP